MEETDEKKDYTNRNILDCFAKLSHKQSDVRIEACAKILKLLEEKQAAEQSGDLSFDLKYSVARLVKGLASARDAARLGFSLLLTEIIKKIPAVSIEDILYLMEKHLTYTHKSDKRDTVFGQLFAYSALVRSRELADHSHLSFVFIGMCQMWQGKSYILNASYEIVLDLFSQLSKETFKAQIWPHMKIKLEGGWEKCPLDFLWLLLLSLRMFPDIVNEKYLRKHWGGDVFSADNSDNIKKLIKQSTVTLPTLHPFCLEFLHLLKDRRNKKELWISLVDDNLFDLDQREKAFLGFEMLKHMLQQIKKKKDVKFIVSPKFQAVFHKAYLNPKHPMNASASQLAKYLCEYAASSDPETQILILKLFLRSPATVIEFQVIKKKEMSPFIQKLHPDAVKAFCEILKTVAVKRKKSQCGEEDEDLMTSKRCQAISQIANLVLHSAVTNDTTWKLSAIQFLLLHSFYNVTTPVQHILHCEEETIEIKADARSSFRDAFYNTLSSLYLKSDHQPFIEHLPQLVEYADSLAEASDCISTEFPLDKVQEPWTNMKSTVRKLSKQSKKDGRTMESRVFQVLFLNLGFYLLQEPDSVSSVLEELQICCKKALSARKHPKDESEDGDDPPWFSVLTDILLSLLSKPSYHLRHLVTSVFPLLCPLMTEEALNQILSVISPQSSEEEPMLVNESEGEDLDFESDSSSKDESDSDDGTDGNVDTELEAKVRNALGHAADDSDAESVVLSDSEMFKLDDALSEAFKGRLQKGHTQMGEEEKALLHFRLRCLDLVQKFLKSEPPMHLALACLEPLLSAYESSRKSKLQKDLVKKSMAVLEMLMRIKKFQNTDGVAKSELKRLLECLISRCHKELDLTLGCKLYKLCVFLVLCSRKLENQKSSNKKSSKLPFYVKLYLSALEGFANGSNSHLLPQFFVTLLQSCPDLAWNFIEPCQKYAFDSSVRIFKKTQCFGLIYEALKFSRSQDSVSLEQWLEIKDTLLPAAVQALVKAIENVEFKPAHVTELLDIISIIHSILKGKTNTAPLENHKNLLPLLESLNKKQKMMLAQKGRNARQHIIRELGGESPTDSNVELRGTKRKSKVKKSKKRKKSEAGVVDIKLNGDL